MPTKTYDPRTDQLLALLPSTTTERDFAVLALACADQAGLNSAAQANLALALAIDLPRSTALIDGIRAIPAVALIATLSVFRAQLTTASDETVRTTLTLMTDEVVAELGRRNAAVIADRAAKGSAS